MVPADLDDECDLDAVVRDARAATWSVRAAAGRRLAMCAERPGLDEVLLCLLLDEGDTGVVQATADALLQRQDVHGLRLVLSAFSHSQRPSFPEPSIMDHLYSSIVGDPRWRTRHGRGLLVGQLTQLLAAPEEPVRAQARQLLGSPALTGERPD
jgi:hypothetical protein